MTLTKGKLVRMSIFIVLIALFIIPTAVMAEYYAIGIEKGAATEAQTNVTVTQTTVPLATETPYVTTVTTKPTTRPPATVATTSVPATTKSPGFGAVLTFSAIGITGMAAIALVRRRQDFN
jgi:hypothetical protein